MQHRAIFLHLTDAHVSAAGVEFKRDEHKVDLPGVSSGRREAVLDDLFVRLAEVLSAEDRRLDGVIFSGDAQSQGQAGGHEAVFDMLARRLEAFGATPDRIVATPGNHDVPRGTPPGSAERYADFCRVWRDRGCVVPWLDGIDPWPLTPGQMDRHRLVASDGSWAVFPVNTSNWSHVSSVLPQPLRDVWDAIPDVLAPNDAVRAGELRSQLQALARYDMARVSERQLEALRAIMASTTSSPQSRTFKVAVMHHHLRSPTLREELKPFADISNLEAVRGLLRDQEIDVVMHGHKHEHAAYFDHIYAKDGAEAHRALVISGATFEVGNETDAARIVTIDGLPHTPEASIQRLSLPRAGIGWSPGKATVRRLWVRTARTGDPVVVVPGAPVTVEGADIDAVYAKACAAAASDAKRGTLIVNLELPDDLPGLPLPAGYPFPDRLAHDARDEWLRDLVKWWQRDRSQLEHRIPFIHGVRLRRYGGKIDQIRRIIDLLRSKESTRAVAVLVDPFRDFASGAGKEEFASFCLVEFRRRSREDGATVIDAIAFYRAQEFRRWWPVNVAELRVLQEEIGAELNFKPGRITTVAADARTIARSPTQVAMPIIDRLLDQAPERLHLLADAIVHRSVRSEPQQLAVSGWTDALSELRSAAEEFNGDGLPIAIEGLRALASYIDVGAESDDPDARDIAYRLKDLADRNESYESSKREIADFNRWAPSTIRLVDELGRLTAKRLSAGNRTV